MRRLRLRWPLYRDYCHDCGRVWGIQRPWYKKALPRVLSDFEHDMMPRLQWSDASLTAALENQRNAARLIMYAGEVKKGDTIHIPSIGKGS